MCILCAYAFIGFALHFMPCACVGVYACAYARVHVYVCVRVYVYDLHHIIS